MSEFKEVWFVWDGEGKAPSQSDLVGVITNGFHWRNNQAYPPEHFDLPLLYTSGQKRRRVKCGCKDGVFYMPSVESGYYEPHPCNKCNGTGFKKGEWEYKQGVE